MSDCIFCKIVAGEIPSDKIYEDDKILAFKDIFPLAKIHCIFIPKTHESDVNQTSDKNPDAIVDIFSAISKVTKEQNLVNGGFRVVANYGPDGGQTVFHTHFHLLSGEKLGGFGAF